MEAEGEEVKLRIIYKKKSFTPFYLQQKYWLFWVTIDTFATEDYAIMTAKTHLENLVNNKIIWEGNNDDQKTI